jgi:Protein of unknown function (DUF1552)
MTTRRMFLRSAGGALLGLPFLPSLLPRGVHAGVGNAPCRFIAMQSQSGQLVGDFWPTLAPTGYQTRDQMYGGARSDGTVALHEPVPGSDARWGRLSDFAGAPLSTVLTDGLEPFYEKLLLLRGLDYLQGTSHGGGMMLGNYANCASGGEFESRGLGWMPTIDQVLAYSDAFYPTTPRARSLALATGSPETISNTDYGIAGGPVETVYPYLQPQHLWEDLFGDFMEPGMPTEHPNRKLVNAIYDDYARLRQNRRLSAADRAALDRHMSFIDDLENELANGVAAGCTKPDQPAIYDDLEYPWQEVGIDNFQRAVELLVDISAAAIRCDMTRIVTMQLQMAITDAAGALATSYHSSDDVAGDWHDFAHDALAEELDRAHIISLNRWVGQMVFRRYLEQLDVEEAEGRTYLDNSLVYWGGELSMDHYVLGMPTVLAGGAGGRLQTGYYVDYTQLAGSYANAGIMPWGVLIPGLPHHRLLATILQAMGLQPSDYERDGLPGYGHREFFGGPYNMDVSVYDLAAIGQPLPGIFVG